MPVAARVRQAAKTTQDDMDQWWQQWEERFWNSVGEVLLGLSVGVVIGALLTLPLRI